MLLIISLLLLLTNAEIIINDSTPFVLAELEKDTCYGINLDMKVACLVTTTVTGNHHIDTETTLARLYVSYGNEKKFLLRFWNRYQSFERGKMVGNYIVNNRFIILNNNKFIILNNTEFRPVIMIEKGENCIEAPLVINIYKLDIEKLDCNAIPLAETLGKIIAYGICALIAIFYIICI